MIWSISVVRDSELNHFIVCVQLLVEPKMSFRGGLL